MKEYYLKNVLQHDSLNIHVDKWMLNSDFPFHTHDYCELVFIVSGTGTHIVEDMEYTLKKGDIFVIKGHEKHAFFNTRNLVYFNIMFQIYDLRTDDCKNLPGFWLLFIHEQQSNFWSYIHVENTEYNSMLNWCEQLFSEYTNHQPGYISICHSILMQIIVFLSRTCQLLENQKENLTISLAKAIVYMQTNYEKKITIDFLADMTGFSKRHFCVFFSKYTICLLCSS